MAALGGGRGRASAFLARGLPGQRAPKVLRLHLRELGAPSRPQIPALTRDTLPKHPVSTARCRRTPRLTRVTFLEKGPPPDPEGRPRFQTRHFLSLKLPQRSIVNGHRLSLGQSRGKVTRIEFTSRHFEVIAGHFELRSMHSSMQSRQSGLDRCKISRRPCILLRAHGISAKVRVTMSSERDIQSSRRVIMSLGSAIITLKWRVSSSCRGTSLRGKAKRG